MIVFGLIAGIVVASLVFVMFHIAKAPGIEGAD